MQSYQSMEKTATIRQRSATTEQEEDADLTSTNGIEVLKAPPSPSAIKAPDANDEEEQQTIDPEDQFLMDCHAIIDLGLAAYKYGAGGINVERFLTRLLQTKLPQVGKAVVRFSNAEVFVSIYRSRPGSSRAGNNFNFPLTLVLDLTEGYQMDKLGRLSDVCKQVEANAMSLADSIHSRNDIEAAPDPYGLFISFLDWVVVGFALAPVLGGSWWDSLVAAALSVLTFWTSFAIGKFCPARVQDPWNIFGCAFLSAVVATTIRVTGSDINIVLTTLSSLAIPLPGFAVSLGVGEIVVGRMLPGIAHLAKGLATLGWLTFGVFVGYELVLACAGGGPESEDTHPPGPVPGVWQALFVPLLCIGLGLAFQTSFPHDFFWAVVLQGITYTIAYAFSYLPTGTGGDIGMVVSSVIMTLMSGIWSWWKDRPINIILIPCTVLQVSGSIGFRGIISLFEGESSVGEDQILQMFRVALLIIVGVLVGMAILPAPSTL